MMHPFKKKIRGDYQRFVQGQESLFPKEDVLKMDLHCHDANSDVPDELWGRILRIPETWLATDSLVARLKENGCGAITITNHNNARSCWDLKDRGVDVLSGAEFTCAFPENDIQFHVLAYGFTPEEEEKLKVLRRNIYKFQAYTAERNIPTVLPHPLYFYNPSNAPGLAVFYKLALLFERFEVLNGQRDTWQNLLALTWVRSLTPEVIDGYSRSTGLSPKEFCRKPYLKRLTGGSDDHMGLFAGACGSQLYVPNLAQRLKTESASDLALEVLRVGDMGPYGNVADSEKLNLAFLDYFCQIALNMKDPGLIRMFLHRGSLKDKILCLGISNAMQELKRHKYTLRFFKTFHQALAGKRPSWWTYRTATADFKPMVSALDKIAITRKRKPDQYLETLYKEVPELSHNFIKLMLKRMRSNWDQCLEKRPMEKDSLDSVIRKLELPSHLRVLFSGEGSQIVNDMSQVNLSELFDNLSFPLLGASVMMGSEYASHKVLNNNRAFLNTFAKELGRYEHPKRLLWLTDTLFDQNGVASALQNILKEVRRANLPIDFLTCGDESKSGDHLHFVPVLEEATLPLGDHTLKIPNLAAAQRIFTQGGYDRIICSTEMCMGLVGLYLKSAFTVPIWFYMHTDWLDYIEKNTKLDSHALDRARRLLRAFYKRFDGVFALNTYHQQWLSSPAIGLAEDKVLSTSHWVDEKFKPTPGIKSDVFPGVCDDDPVLLFAGRVSEEKGVFDLPIVYNLVKEAVPNVKMVFAGTGPAEEKLRKEIPHGIYMGWIDANYLIKAYSSADLLLLPSRFDTFGCVVLEAMSCGCLVAAYDAKGPRDIINHGVNGFLANSPEAMASQAITYLRNPDSGKRFKQFAIDRASEFRAGEIMNNLMMDVGLTPQSEQRLMRIAVKTRIMDRRDPEKEDILAEFLDIMN